MTTIVAIGIKIGASKFDCCGVEHLVVINERPQP